MLRLIVLAVGFLNCLAAVEATAVLFDGTERRGPLSAADGRLTLGGSALDLQEVDRLRLAGEPSATEAGLGLWLSDGSWLPITAVASASAADRIVAHGPLGTLDLPLSAVRGWGSELPAPGDGDVVVLASGTYAARVSGITAGQLAFTGTLGEVAVPVGDVQALRLAGNDRPARGLTLAVSLDPTRPPLHLLPGTTPRLAAAPEVALSTWPAGSDLRVEGGRRVYLGTLKPAAVHEEGAFGVVWPHAIDRNLEGGPLLLGGERFAHGLSLHSQCTIAWQLDGGYQRLHAVVGIADEVRPEGDCPVTLLGDGKVLWQAERLTGRDKPQTINVALAGIKRIEWRVAFGNRFDIGDRVAVADAYLVKNKK